MSSNFFKTKIEALLGPLYEPPSLLHFQKYSTVVQVD